MADKLLLVSWLVCTIYSSIPLFWLAIHPFAHRWQKMRRSPYRLLLPLWALLIAAILFLTSPRHSIRLYSSIFSLLAALPFFVVGASTYIRIRSEFGLSNLAGESELRPAEKQTALVITGLHSRMRHPIYFAHLIMLAGWAVASGLAVNFALLAISALLTFPLMIWMEENELEQRFGATYRQYRQTVPLFSVLNRHAIAEESD
jgi:protein-S-isoprenylcysteine O-methyltransferase Ste14